MNSVVRDTAQHEDGRLDVASHSRVGSLRWLRSASILASFTTLLFWVEGVIVDRTLSVAVVSSRLFVVVVVQVCITSSRSHHVPPPLPHSPSNQPLHRNIIPIPYQHRHIHIQRTIGIRLCQQPLHSLERRSQRVRRTPRRWRQQIEAEGAGLRVDICVDGEGGRGEVNSRWGERVGLGDSEMEGKCGVCGAGQIVQGRIRNGPKQ